MITAYHEVNGNALQTNEMLLIEVLSKEIEAVEKLSI